MTSKRRTGTKPAASLIGEFIRDNGLALALLAAFAFSVAGMAAAGWANHNAELAEHGRPPVGLAGFLASGAFLSPLFENWESEFLQMSAYVVFTAYLFQRGSAESLDPDAPRRRRDVLPVRWRRRSRLTTWIYSYSLGLALALLFLASFVLHWLSGTAAANQEALRHGGTAKPALAYVADAQFWFESFQNWQSEFLSTAVLVLLSVFLRYKGSPESKPLSAKNHETGT